MSDANSACATVILCKQARKTVRTVEFWQQNWGYVFWGLIGLLCAIAGTFQPIDSLKELFIVGAIVLFTIGLVLSGDDIIGFLIVLGFGGFLLAMYGLGFVLASFLFGWAIIAFIIAILLYGLGALGVESQ